MGWIGGTSNSYKKNIDTDNFKFIRKKKSKKTGPLGINMGEATKSLVDVNKKQAPLK